MFAFLTVMDAVSMKAVLKIMPPTLICWPTAKEADAGEVAVEIETSHQYEIILLP